MVRVLDLKTSMDFYCKGLGLTEISRKEHEKGRFTLVFLATKSAPEVQIELTYNWDQKDKYNGGRNFGHIAYEVDDIYAKCKHLQELGIEILRPPRDGRMAFIRSPDDISIELLQKGSPLDICSPWDSMPNQGDW